MDPTEPARQYAEKAIESIKQFQQEQDELDKAFLRGRVGDLIRKYSEKYNPPEEDEEEQKGESDEVSGSGEPSESNELPETD